VAVAGKKDNGLKAFLRRPERKRRYGRLVLLLILLVICYIYVGGDYGLLKIWSQHRQVQELRREIHRLHAEQYDLKREGLLLEGDSLYIEKKAREELGMVRQGERVYQFVTPADSTNEIAEDEI
jgi:cell division protein FtsB